MIVCDAVTMIVIATLHRPAILQCLAVPEPSALSAISLTGTARSVNIAGVLRAPLPPDLPPGRVIDVVRLVAGTDGAVGAPVTAASVPPLGHLYILLIS